MAARKEIEKVVKYKEFQRSVEKLLTPEDEDYLFYALKEYNTYKSVGKLMLALNSCLDSPEKLDLLPYIRDLIPKHDKKRFDRLAPYDRMAHPLQIEPPAGIRTVGGVSGDSSTATSQNRIVSLQRNKDLALGFSIRGGQEHDLGIYVSHVESLSQAEKAGLQVGDQIIRVNGIDFERVSHGSAVLVLTSHDNLKIEVKNTGKVPGQVLNKHTFVWVDAYGNPVEEPDEDKHSKRHSIVREERSPDRLLSSADKRKIVLHSSKKRSLGFSIRGGSEYGLGVYISVVDPGSPSEEAGLRVGDQIMDINGHSFLSILHYEAVHILKSYATLIMTIKSLGRIPTLKINEQNEAEPMEQSPITRRKSSEMFKSSSVQVKRSKRPTSATIVEEEEPDEPDHAHSSALSSQQRPRSASLRHFESDRSSNLKRSDSQRSSQSASLSHHNSDFDSADSKKSRSFSFGGAGIPNFSQRPSIMKKTMTVSPLATHEARASTASSPSPISSPTTPDAHTKARPKFFERGLGTQVMLANVSSQAKQLLFDKARRELSDEDAEILKEDLVQYDDTGNIEQFVHCLISIFNTPEKMELMRDVRSVIKPTDIVKFDEMISPHELKTLRERISESDSDQDEWDDLNIDALENSKEDGIVLTGIQHKNGYEEQEVFGNRKRLASRSNGRNNGSYLLSNSAPELHEVRSKETSFSQSKLEDSITLTARRSNGSQHDSPKLSAKPFRTHGLPPLETRPQGNPVIIDIDKEAPYIGLAIRTTHDNCVLVKDVRPGGAIDRDGFIQPGFEIVQVDNIRIRGKSYHDAAREIADAFKGFPLLLYSYVGGFLWRGRPGDEACVITQFPSHSH